jgi:hypothetical protein
MEVTHHPLPYILEKIKIFSYKNFFNNNIPTMNNKLLPLGGRLVQLA